MQSLFFNLKRTHYRRSFLHRSNGIAAERIDISNGVVLLRATVSDGIYRFDADYIDATAMVIGVRRGTVYLKDMSGKTHKIKAGTTSLCAAGRASFSLTWKTTEGTCDAFVLFAADFFIARYLCDEPNGPLEKLYGKLTGTQACRMLDTLPLDPLSEYLVEHILHAERFALMRSLRAEIAALEYLVHRLELWDSSQAGIAPEDRHLAARAKAVLLERFVSPPTLQELAHMCATNTARLTTAFKAVYGMTLYAYVRHLRMQEAMKLLTHETLHVGEVAKRVGYRHQGHFTKRFIETFGISPGQIVKRTHTKNM